MPGDRSFEVARAISEIGAFAQKERPRLRQDTKHEGHRARIDYLFLHRRQFDVQDSFQLFRLQLMKYDHAVEPVYEFREKRRRTASTAVRSSLASSPAGLVDGSTNPIPLLTKAAISRAPRLDVRNMIV